MTTRLNPHLNFRDNTREAMEFYQTVFGGELRMQTFKEYHASQDPSEDDKIMHAMLEGDDGITFMAVHTPNHMEYSPGSNFNMSVIAGTGIRTEDVPAFLAGSSRPLDTARA